jgi:MFS superfamily sulfate permease-like transporter
MRPFLTGKNFANTAILCFHSCTGLVLTIFNGSLVISSLVNTRNTKITIPFTDNNTGITIGAVVVPQGMAYAGLAGLPPQYGLYSSFMGVLIYWFFATSKDITIGVSLKS